MGGMDKYDACEVGDPDPDHGDELAALRAECGEPSPSAWFVCSRAAHSAGKHVAVMEVVDGPGVVIEVWP